MNKQDKTGEQVQILSFNDHDQRLNDLQLNLVDDNQVCRCWNKNKFCALNSNSTSNRTSRSSIRSCGQSDRVSDESNLKMNQISRIDQYSSLDQIGFQVKQSDLMDPLQFDDDEQFYTPIEGYEVLDKRKKFTIYKLRVECLSSSTFWFIYRYLIILSYLIILFLNFVNFYSNLNLIFPFISPKTEGSQTLSDLTIN